MIVINWHVTDKCNYSCLYCYAKYDKDETSKMLIKDFDKSKLLLNEIYDFFTKKYGDDIKLNFAGGEPFLLKKYLIPIIIEAKKIGFITSFISNGSLLDEDTAIKLRDHIDIAGFSVDSFSDEVNIKIGRKTNNNKTLNKESLINVINLMKESGVKIKINSVISSMNKDEYMNNEMAEIAPDKWKVLKVLPVITNEYNVSELMFDDFLRKHVNTKFNISRECNEDMTESYIMIDPFRRFFQNQSKECNHYIYSDIINSNIDKCFKQIKFDIGKFKKRYM